MPSRTPMSTRHGVLLVEDDEYTRDRLARAVAEHPALELLAAVGSCAEARRELDRRQPAVLLTDLGLPDGDGVELIREVRRRGFKTETMVVTIFGDEQHVVTAIEAGAMGYLLKDGSPDYIGQSILDMLAGGSPISPPIARYLLRRFRTIEAAPAAEPADLPRLSEREREVLGLIVKGFSYAEAARLTGTSPHTVTAHVRNIYRKLEVHSRGEAVYEALQLGLVKLDE
jgi:DNA-binding NarL/FixJ family response regulator